MTGKAGWQFLVVSRRMSGRGKQAGKDCGGENNPHE
jgi:hypothetical protein